MASQRLPGVHSGIKQTLTSGDPLARSMSNYKKGYDPMQAAANAGLPAAQDEEASPVPVVRKGDGKGGGLKTPRDYQKAADVLDAPSSRAGVAARAFQ